MERHAIRQAQWAVVERTAERVDHAAEKLWTHRYGDGSLTGDDPVTRTDPGELAERYGGTWSDTNAPTTLRFYRVVTQQ